MRREEYACPNGCSLPPRKRQLREYRNGTYGFDFYDFTFCPCCGSLMPYSLKKLKGFFEVYNIHAALSDAVQVGEKMAQVLNAAGIRTLHDETLYDAPGYTDSYKRSRAGGQAYLERYPSIKVVLDVHRDAIEDSDGTRWTSSTTFIEG